MHANRRFWIPFFALALLLGACAEEAPNNDGDAGIGGRDGGRGGRDAGVDVPGDTVSDTSGDTGITDGPSCADFTECDAGSYCAGGVLVGECAEGYYCEAGATSAEESACPPGIRIKR